jgi:hypothetical protein
MGWLRREATWAAMASPGCPNESPHKLPESFGEIVRWT